MEQVEPVKRAVSFFTEGYLCSQSLLLAYAPRLGIEPQMAARIAAPFGAGMGRMGWTCGAVTGALMVIGMRCGHESADDREKKERTVEMVKEFVSRFKAWNGSVVCKELLGHDLSTPAGLKSARAEGLFETRCPRLVRDAAVIVGEVIDSGCAQAAPEGSGDL